ncbi:MAG: ATP-binding protein [Actinomycetota bacterium]
MRAHDRGTAAGTARRMELAVPATAQAGSEVRRALERMGLPLPLQDDAQLLATELVTNSFKHSGLAPDQLIRVIIEWSGERLRVSVRDRIPTTRLPISGSIRPYPEAESGWGLYLVDRIASGWGTGAGGYWFELTQERYPEDS